MSASFSVPQRISASKPDLRVVIPALTGTALLLAWAVFHEGGRPIEPWQYSLLGWGLIGLFYARFTQRENFAPIGWLILLLPCYALFQFLTVSVKPGATFAHFLRLAAFAVVFIIIRDIARKRIWAAGVPIIVIAALEASLGLLRYFFGADAAGGAHGTYPNRNHFAGLLEMALPFAVVYALKWRISWVAAGLIFTGIVCSHSRGGFISALMSLAIMALIALSKENRRRKWLAAAPLPAGILLLFIYAPPDLFFNRFAKASEAEISTIAGRLLFLRDSQPLITKYAALGCGLGGFESAFYPVKTVFNSYTVDFAHNDYVQGFIELGAVGFTIPVALLVMALKRAIEATEGPKRLPAIACIGAISAILLHSLVDFNLYIPANAMTLIWISAIAFSVRPRESVSHHQSRPSRKSS